MKEKISVLIDEKTVDEKINEIGKVISQEYEGRQVHMICVLKGGVFFMTELAKRVSVPVSMDFMAVSSYKGTKSSGSIQILKDLDEDIAGKDVLIVEDIVDTGRTLKTLTELLIHRGAKSVKICTLLDKPETRIADIQADYSCFTVPDKFVVGYGLDYEQKYRNLPYIGVIDFVEEV